MTCAEVQLYGAGAGCGEMQVENVGPAAPRQGGEEERVLEHTMPRHQGTWGARSTN